MFGVFDSYEKAELAVQELNDNGFNGQRVSVVMKETIRKTHQSPTLGESVAEGTISGVTTGGVLGALAGLLIGIGAIAIPGIGGLLIGGPLAAALGLTGAAATTVSGAATGALAGGILGALTGLGLPEETAKTYATRIEQGGVLVSVDTESEIEQLKVSRIYDQFGAHDIYTS
jgi:hypothetical protein